MNAPDELNEVRGRLAAIEALLAHQLSWSLAAHPNIADAVRSLKLCIPAQGRPCAESYERIVNGAAESACAMRKKMGPRLRSLAKPEKN